MTSPSGQGVAGTYEKDYDALADLNVMVTWLMMMMMEVIELQTLVRRRRRRRQRHT